MRLVLPLPAKSISIQSCRFSRTANKDAVSSRWPSAHPIFPPFVDTPHRQNVKYSSAAAVNHCSKMTSRKSVRKPTVLFYLPHRAGIWGCLLSEQEELVLNAPETATVKQTPLSNSSKPKTTTWSILFFCTSKYPNLLPPMDQNEHIIFSGFSSGIWVWENEAIPPSSFQAFGPKATLPPHPLMLSFDLSSSSFSDGIFWCHTIFSNNKICKGRYITLPGMGVVSADKKRMF